MAGLVTAGLRLVSVSETRGIKNFTGAIRQMRVDMLGFEQVNAILQTMGQNLTKLGTMGLKGIGSVAKSAVKLDDVMTQLSAVSKGTDKTIDELTSGFLDLSSALPLSAEQLGQVGVEAARAGIQSGQAIDSIALASGKLAALGDDLTEQAASKALITISNNFKIETEDMADNVDMLADSLAGLDSAGIATAKQIADVTVRASAARGVFKITQKDLAALSTAALNSGASAEVAGTAIFGLLNRMSKGTEKFAAASGTSAEELQNLINSGQGIIALRKFLVGIRTNADGSARSFTDVGKAFKQAGLGGRRLGAVVGNLSLNIEKLDAALGIANDSTGELERKFGIFSTSAAQKIKTLQGSLENLAFSFGLVLKPVIVGFVNVVNPLINLLTAIPAPIKFIMLATLALVSTLTALAGVSVTVVAGLGVLVTSAVFLAKAGLESFKAWKAFTKQLRSARSAMIETAAASKVLAAANARFNALPPGSSRSKRLGARNNLRAAQARRRAGSARLKDAKKGDFKSPVFAVLGLEERFKGTTAAFTKLKTAILGTPVGKVLGSWATQAGALKATIGPLIASIGTAGFSGALSATAAAAVPLLIVFAKVAAVIGAAVILSIALKDEIKGLVGAVMSIINPFVKFVSDMANAVGLVQEGVSGFDMFIMAVRVAVFPLILFMKFLEMNLRAVGAAIGVILNFIVTLFKPIGEIVGRIIDGFKVMGEALAFDLELLFGFKNEGNFIIGIVDSMASALTWLLQPIADFLAFLIKINLTLAGGFAFGVFEALAMFVGEIMLALKPLGDELMSLFDEVVSVFDPFIDTFKEMFAVLGFGGEEIDGFSLVVKAVSTSLKVALIPLKIMLKLFILLIRAVVFLARVFTGIFKFSVAVLVAPFKLLVEIVKALHEFFTGGPLTMERFGASMKKLAGNMLDFLNPFSETEEEKKKNKAKRRTQLQDKTQSVSFGHDMAKQAARVFDPLGMFGLLSSAVANEEKARKEKLQQLNTGGITRKDTVAQLHRNEVVIPLNRIGEVTGNMQARASASPQPVAAAGPGASISLTIPVNVMMGDMVMGRALVQLSEERMRREFSSRGIRLAGIG
jgi:TP901 family phage tail tape measure protein